jgi:hypothetical protein
MATSASVRRAAACAGLTGPARGSGRSAATWASGKPATSSAVMVMSLAAISRYSSSARFSIWRARASNAARRQRPK